VTRFAKACIPISIGVHRAEVSPPTAAKTYRLN